MIFHMDDLSIVETQVLKLPAREAAAPHGGQPSALWWPRGLRCAVGGGEAQQAGDTWAQAADHSRNYHNITKQLYSNF